jgi:phage-related protein
MAAGVELATAYFSLVPSMDGVAGATKQGFGDSQIDKTAEEAGKRTGGRFTAGARVAITAGAAVLSAGIVKVFQTGMDELKFGEQISAQTDQLIANTGAAFSTSWVEDYTLALSQVSGISEEALQEAGNSVLKFGDVSQGNFERAVGAINDMGAAGKDVKGVGEALGKALAEPAEAAGLLKRAGVILDDEQQKLIDSFTAVGDKAGAQAVILDSLEGTYGGMAEATGATLTGNLNKLGNAWENTAAIAVEALMPAIMGIVDVLGTVFTWIQDNEGIMPLLAVGVGILAAAFIALSVAMWAASVTPIGLAIAGIVIAIGLLIAGIVALVMNWDTVVKFISDIWGGFLDWVASVTEGFVSWWNDVWEGFGNFLADIWRNIVTGIETALGFVSAIIGKVLETITGVWESMWQGMVDFLSTVFAGIVGVAKAPINGIIALINGAIEALNQLSVTIPDWVPVIGGQTWGLNLPKIPMLAEGGTILRSGSVIVGENGPELLRLPRGASVDPDISGAGTGAGIEITQYIYPAEGMSEQQVGRVAAEKIAFAMRGN